MIWKRTVSGGIRAHVVAGDGDSSSAIGKKDLSLSVRRNDVAFQSITDAIGIGTNQRPGSSIGVENLNAPSAVRQRHASRDIQSDRISGNNVAGSAEHDSKPEVSGDKITFQRILHTVAIGADD